MLRTSLSLLWVLLVPCVVFAEGPLANFIATKHVGDNHMFAYRCNDTGHVVEVEQRYNAKTKTEEVRFLVDGMHGEWLTQGINAGLYRASMDKACSQSTSKTVFIAKD